MGPGEAPQYDTLVRKIRTRMKGVVCFWWRRSRREDTVSFGKICAADAPLGRISDLRAAWEAFISEYHLVCL